jgi:hypothetical protein
MSLSGKYMRLRGESRGQYFIKHLTSWSSILQ